MENDIKELTKKINNSTELLGNTYRQLKRAIYYQLLFMFFLLGFLAFSFFASEPTKERIIYYIIPLIMFNYLLVVWRRIKIKNNFLNTHSDTINDIWKLSDIIDWSSARNKFISKENHKTITSISHYFIVIEKPFSPIRRKFNYYKLVLYFSILVLLFVVSYYIIVIVRLINISS